MNVFGPVPSRRLGRSLGINTISSKVKELIVSGQLAETAYQGNTYYLKRFSAK